MTSVNPSYLPKAEAFDMVPWVEKFRHTNLRGTQHSIRNIDVIALVLSNLILLAFHYICLFMPFFFCTLSFATC